MYCIHACLLQQSVCVDSLIAITNGVRATCSMSHAASYVQQLLAHSLVMTIADVLIHQVLLCCTLHTDIPS
jgi:hypothetical protein